MLSKMSKKTTPSISTIERHVFPFGDFEREKVADQEQNFRISESPG